mmetsp:Transcript_785/g.2045  ORF Transcript_785/g.2045 Transcript_785/m.2045 type:complete len:208 (+) Transcript_785:233-856(+)
MYTPSSGGFRTSSFSKLKTLVRLTTSSSAQFSLACLRQTSCRLAVRNPWGLKKPVSQKQFGLPCFSQDASCSARSRMFPNQTPIVGATKSETFVQRGGTRARKRESTASDRSDDITMVPAMASLRLLSDARITVSTFCRRSISCPKQMFSGFGPPSALMLAFTSSARRSGGSFDSRVSTSRSTTSSRLSPELIPESFGEMSSIVESI